MANGTFTICAGNMYAFKFFLRISEKAAKPEGIGQVLFKGSSANSTEHGKPGEEIVEGLLVGHEAKIVSSR